jgi:hypothetical protein
MSSPEQSDTPNQIQEGINDTALASLLSDDERALQQIFDEHPATRVFRDLVLTARAQPATVGIIQAVREQFERYREAMKIGGYGVNPSEDPRLRLTKEGRPETLTIVNAGILAFDVKGSSILATLIPMRLGQNIMEFLSGHFFTHVEDILRYKDWPWKKITGVSWEPGRRHSFGGDSLHIVTEVDRDPNGRILLNQLDKATIVAAQLVSGAEGISEACKQEYSLTLDGGPLIELRTGFTQDNVSTGDIFTLDRPLGGAFESCQRAIRAEFEKRGLPYRDPMSPGLPAAPANSLSPGMNEASRLQGKGTQYPDFFNITTAEYLHLMCPALQPLYEKLEEGVEVRNVAKGRVIYGMKREHADYRKLYEICREFYMENAYY